MDGGPGRRWELAALGALTVALLVWFLAPYALDGFGLPLGPDAPVYLWWIRLAGLEGLSAVGHRPGAPALALALRGALGLSDVQVVAALEGALGVATGLAASGLVRLGLPRARSSAWILAGLLAGTFAVHLAAGYLANLAFAVVFLAAAGLLAEGARSGSRRAGVAAALVLGAGGLAHPLFFLLGAGVLLLSAGLGRRVDPAGSIRIAGAVLGAGAVVGAGLLAMLAGPRPPTVDTSKDGFLRRAGLLGELRRAYLDRFVHRWTRYVQWLSVPLAVAGLATVRGFLGRFLGAWGLVTLLGVGVCLATGLAPADRLVTFGFVVPILAALGLVRLAEALGRRRALAAGAVSALTAAMLAGAGIAWHRQEPFLSQLEIERIAEASRWIAATPPGTALVFPVNQSDPAVTFLATRAANVLRAAVPRERIRDVVVVVPAPGGPADPVRRALSRITLADAEGATAERDGRRLDVLLAPFDRPDAADAGPPWRRVSRGVFLAGDVPATPASAVEGRLRPSSPGGIAAATALAIGLLSLAGYGWARALLADRIAALALAPALGAAAITLVAVALERLGLALDGGAASGVAVSALGGGGGYLLRLILQRRA